jgi:endonuclease/exonuclease/phosphatase family metal-dependent hydrolase
VGFVLASYNVLGHSHTTPRGTRPSWAAGTTRIRWVIRLLRRHRVDVVGLQELQRPQWRVLRRHAPEYRVFPGAGGPRDTDNAIAWRHTQWRLVRAGSVPIPYFHGRIKQMPVLLLRHRPTGRQAWFANFHNPASLPWLGSQRRWRSEALRRQVSLVRRLHRNHPYPVFVTGDMNDHHAYYCPFTRATGTTAAAGGTSTRTHCTPPRRARIDWIFGSPGARFRDYTTVTGPLARKTSDHPLIHARARLRGDR